MTSPVSTSTFTALWYVSSLHPPWFEIILPDKVTDFIQRVFVPPSPEFLLLWRVSPWRQIFDWGCQQAPYWLCQDPQGAYEGKHKRAMAFMEERCCEFQHIIRYHPQDLIFFSAWFLL